MALVRKIISTIPKTLSTTTTTTARTTSNNRFRREITNKSSEELPSWLPSNSKEVAVNWSPNGAMKRGHKFFYKLWDNEKGINGWVLMPGVPKKNVKVNVIGHKIYFEGFEDEFVKGLPKDMLRLYKGMFVVDPHKFDTSKLHVQMINGVLWVHAPNFN